jgi:PAS domain S-box-containing protein
MYRAERDLSRSLHVYKNMVSSSNDHVACIGADGRFIAVNNAFVRAYGRTEDGVIGHAFSEVHGEGVSLEDVRGFLERTLGGEQVLYEGWHELPGAGQRYLFTTLYPYINNDGERAGTVLNAVDLTERVHVEKQVVEIGNLERISMGMELHD